MAFEISPNGSNGRVAPSSRLSESGGERRTAPTQSFNELADMRIALARKARTESVQRKSRSEKARTQICARRPAQLRPGHNFGDFSEHGGR